MSVPSPYLGKGSSNTTSNSGVPAPYTGKTTTTKVPAPATKATVKQLNTTVSKTPVLKISTPTKLSTGLKLDLTPPTQASSAKLVSTPQSRAADAKFIKQEDVVAQKAANTFPQTNQTFKQLTVDPLSLKVNPKKAIDNAVNTIKISVASEKDRIKDLMTEPRGIGGTKKIGKGLKVVTGGAGVVFSPISALFEGANQIPVLGSVSRALSAAFSIAGEGATGASNKIIDALPISAQTKANLKPGVGEIFALAAQIELGRATGGEKVGELTKKYGKEDAKTIIKQAQTLAKEKISTKDEYTPQEVIDSVVNSKLQDTPDGKALLKTAVEAQKQDMNIKVGENAPTELVSEKPITVKSTDELLTYIDRQGFREPAQIETLKADIAKNGIKYPVELIQKADGTFQINDGTHRIQIAKDLGIEEIPTKVVKTEAPVETKVKSTPKTEEVSAKPSKIGKSIEAKAIESGLTKGFPETAGFTPQTIKEQSKLSSDLVNKHFEDARAIIRGEKELPNNLNPLALVKAMEEYIKQNRDPEVAYELANSPLVSQSSGAAQILRFAAEREPDSATAKLQELKKAREDKIKDYSEKKTTLKAKLKADIKKTNLSKEDLNWNKFLDQIQC